MSWERFVWETGKPRRVMHLSSYDRLGGFAGALCGIPHNFNRSCNLPLGKRICRRCIAIEHGLST